MRFCGRPLGLTGGLFLGVQQKLSQMICRHDLRYSLLLQDTHRWYFVTSAVSYYSV